MGYYLVKPEILCPLCTAELTRRAMEKFRKEKMTRELGTVTFQCSISMAGKTVLVESDKLDDVWYSFAELGFNGCQPEPEA